MIPVYFDQVAARASAESDPPKLPPTLADFFELSGLPAQQAQLSRLEALGPGVDGDLERHLAWRVTEALPDV